MKRLGLKPARCRERVTLGSRNCRLRPTVMALEGRALLSTLVVNNTADDGSTGTLRWAIGQFGAKRRTIRLTGGPLVLTDPATTTIVGPGARRLSIGGGGKSGVFDVEGGSLSFSGVTIANGNADLGAGVRNEGGRLVLANVVIRGNRAIVGGGLFNDGHIAMNSVRFKGNRAHVGPGLFNTRTATLTWRRSPDAGRGSARTSSNPWR
jgi:hypothetical protein